MVKKKTSNDSGAILEKPQDPLSEILNRIIENQKQVGEEVNQLHKNQEELAKALTDTRNSLNMVAVEITRRDAEPVQKKGGGMADAIGEFLKFLSSPAAGNLLKGNDAEQDMMKENQGLLKNMFKNNIENAMKLSDLNVREAEARIDNLKKARTGWDLIE